MNIREIVGLAPVIPQLSIVELAHAVPLAHALSAGGLTVLEISLRTPVAHAAIEAMRKAIPGLIVGAGMLTRPIDFAAADRAGAQFGVTPGLTPELAAASRGARFALLPSVMSPTELLAARHAGFNVVRFYPAGLAGAVGMLREMAAVFPDVLFCPSGGITADTAPDYLALPAVASVGGSWVTPSALVQAGDWAGIERLARDAHALRGARGA
jgi:2-dehydro-3-deoxyphosphogluconate aldolase / (4S)-4-hydroxy-2-oxoglutarate aldolase